jgi:hypothetical protein
MGAGWGGALDSGGVPMRWVLCMLACVVTMCAVPGGLCRAGSGLGGAELRSPDAGWTRFTSPGRLQDTYVAPAIVAPAFLDRVEGLGEEYGGEGGLSMLSMSSMSSMSSMGSELGEVVRGGGCACVSVPEHVCTHARDACAAVRAGR